MKPVFYSPQLLELDTRMRQFRRNKLSLKAYARFLKKMTRRQHWPLSNFKQLNTAGRANAGDHSAPMQEMAKLEKALREAMYSKNQERELDHYFYLLQIAEKMVSVSATAKELQYYRAHAREFSRTPILSLLAKSALIHSNHPYLTESLTRLRGYLAAADRFYALADQRSQSFVKNMLRCMTASREPLAVLVAGGFHTALVEQTLKQKNISFISVRPRFSQQDDANPYFALLGQQNTPLEKILSQEAQYFKPASLLNKPAMRRLMETVVKLFTLENILEQNKFSIAKLHLKKRFLAILKHWPRDPKSVVIDWNDIAINSRLYACAVRMKDQIKKTTFAIILRPQSIHCTYRTLESQPMGDKRVYDVAENVPQGDIPSFLSTPTAPEPSLWKKWIIAGLWILPGALWVYRATRGDSATPEFFFSLFILSVQPAWSTSGFGKATARVSTTPAEIPKGTIDWAKVADDMSNQEKIQFARQIFESSPVKAIRHFEAFGMKLPNLNHTAQGIGHDLSNLMASYIEPIEELGMEDIWSKIEDPRTRKEALNYAEEIRPQARRFLKLFGAAASLRAILKQKDEPERATEQRNQENELEQYNHLEAQLYESIPDKLRHFMSFQLNNTTGQQLKRTLLEQWQQALFFYYIAGLNKMVADMLAPIEKFKKMLKSGNIDDPYMIDFINESYLNIVLLKDIFSDAYMFEEKTAPSSLDMRLAYYLVKKRMEKNKGWVEIEVKAERHFLESSQVRYGNYGLLMVMLRNLVKNSENAILENEENSTGQANKITILFTKDKIEVTDTGPGYPQKILDRETPRRGNTTRKETGGSGLGLDMVHRTMKEFFLGSFTRKNLIKTGAMATLTFSPPGQKAAIADDQYEAFLTSHFCKPEYPQAARHLKAAKVASLAGIMAIAAALFFGPSLPLQAAELLPGPARNDLDHILIVVLPFILSGAITWLWMKIKRMTPTVIEPEKNMLPQRRRRPSPRHLQQIGTFFAGSA